MSRANEIFNEYPSVDVIVIMAHDDGGPWGLQENGRKYRYFNDDVVRQLAQLPGAQTKDGFIDEDGYHVYITYDITLGTYKEAAIYRRRPKQV
ncbi:MAG TPA: hypothetical protein VEI57_16720 [Nitrospirota bacterium]|nr:hypothetical protein [Nitrospirota bacterium]